ncbi:fluoride efflux transporter FluC [Actinomycetospora sp. CA-101289]|uniref:fluoride efflux transporter FluC n=1 Tax=Actinomycetospora sp. CA-101289 TaxID=3239893 RepID=UPI003D9684D2
MPSDPPPDPRDPDVVAAQRRGAGVLHGQARPTVAVAAGGVLGALARWAVGLLAPTPPGAFPWATFGINVVGCLLMGVVVAFVVERPGAHPLLRPFLGVGVLGGFTTFSTFAVDAEVLLTGGHRVTALLSLAGTALTAVAATALGLWVTRRLAGVTR